MKKQFFALLVFIISFTVFASGTAEHRQTDSFKIVSLSPNVTQIVFALGSGDSLAGRTDYCDDPEQVTEIPSIGTLYDPNLELIVSLDPDIAIASSITDPAFIEKLNEAGIKSYQFLEEYNGFEGTFNLIRSVGKAIGKEQEAEKIIDKQKQELKEIKDRLAGKAQKTCAIIIGWGEYGSWGATGDTFLNDVIECANGINIAENSRFWSLSNELLLSSDPECIFITPDSNSVPAEKMVESFINTEPYSHLSASKNKRVYLLSSDLCQKQGIRTIEAVKIIATKLYGDLK